MGDQCCLWQAVQNQWHDRSQVPLPGCLAEVPTALYRRLDPGHLEAINGPAPADLEWRPSIESGPA